MYTVICWRHRQRHEYHAPALESLGEHLISEHHYVSAILRDGEVIASCEDVTTRCRDGLLTQLKTAYEDYLDGNRHEWDRLLASIECIPPHQHRIYTQDGDDI